MIVNIHGHDRVRARQFRPQHHAQPDAAAANNDHRFANPHLRVIIDHPKTRRQGVRQQGANFVIRVAGHGRQSIFRNHGIAVESRDETRAGLPAIPIVNRRLRLNSTARTPMQNHPLARLDMLHARPDFEHGSTAFMPQQMRQKAVGAFHPVNFADLRVQLGSR